MLQINIGQKKPSDLPKPRADMTEEDWVAYDNVRYKTWYSSAGIIPLRNGCVLLVKDRHSKKWSFPKGAPEPEDNECTIYTAIREMYEEVGLLPVKDYRIDTHETRLPCNYNKLQYHYFAIVNENARPHVNDEEGEEVRWFSPKELRSLGDSVNMGVKGFIQKYPDRNFKGLHKNIEMNINKPKGDYVIKLTNLVTMEKEMINMKRPREPFIMKQAKKEVKRKVCGEAELLEKIKSLESENTRLKQQINEIRLMNEKNTNELTSRIQHMQQEMKNILVK